jgi:hypothetical protein
VRNLIYLIIIAAIGYGAYTYFIRSGGPDVTIDESDGNGSFITMSNGNVKGEFTRIGDFEIELRVFGTSSDFPKEGPFALMTDMVFASSRDQANSAFNRFLCEKGAVGQASLIQLIINDPQNRSQIEELASNSKQRNCAYLSGTSYHMDRVFMNGEEMEGLRFTSSAKSDPYKFIKVDEFKLIPCD